MRELLFSLGLLAIVLGVSGLIAWLMSLDTSVELAMPSRHCLFEGSAKPGCKCQFCRAVFNEWGAQALGFQKVFNAGHLDRFLGIERIRKAS